MTLGREAFITLQVITFGFPCTLNLVHIFNFLSQKLKQTNHVTLFLQVGLKNVFDECIIAALNPQEFKPKPWKCQIFQFFYTYLLFSWFSYMISIYYSEEKIALWYNSTYLLVITICGYVNLTSEKSFVIFVFVCFYLNINQLLY